MMRKSVRCILLCVFTAAMITLSGCSFSTDTESLLSPPRPTGELYNIQQALDKSVGEKYTLKYPTSGENRSAIILKDLDGDGEEAAVALYSTVKDNIVSMHINLITKGADGWQSAGDFKYVASGVESVEFVDIDGDGTMEIIVGWAVYGNVDKALCVYSAAQDRFVQRINEKFTNYICSDMDGDGKAELFITYLNNKEGINTAKLLALNPETQNDAAQQLGIVELDPAITGYSQPVISKLPDGNPAVYIDAVKGSGLITEVIEIADGTIKNVFAGDGDVANSADATYRGAGNYVRDIDGDGVMEIPLLYIMTQGVSESDNIYRTDWCTVNDGRLEVKMSAMMNYSDGYYIVIPEKWRDKITATRDTAARTRTVMRISEETGNSAQVLVRIQAVPITDGDTSPAKAISNTQEIARTEEFYYVASIGGYSGTEAVTIDEFKSYFKLIEN